MTTCDSPWIMVVLAGILLLGMVAGPSVVFAHRARLERPRLWLALAGALPLAAGIALLAMSEGAREAQLVSLLFVPALVGAAYAWVRPDPARARRAFYAVAVTAAALVLLVGGLAVDAALSPPCPGPEIGG